MSITEFLVLLAALRARVAQVSAQDFYYLARACLIKDERHYDRFDRVFAEVFAGAERLFAAVVGRSPRPSGCALWVQRIFSEEDKQRIEALGGWDKLLETLRERLRSSRSATRAATSGSAPAAPRPSGRTAITREGIRIGQERSGQRRAVKVWERREFSNLDDSVELGTRNLKLALRKLRKFAREGAR